MEVSSVESSAVPWPQKEELDPPAFKSGMAVEEEDEELEELEELEILRLGEPSMLSRICRCSR